MKRYNANNLLVLFGGTAIVIAAVFGYIYPAILATPLNNNGITCLAIINVIKVNPLQGEILLLGILIIIASYFKKARIAQIATIILPIIAMVIALPFYLIPQYHFPIEDCINIYSIQPYSVGICFALLVAGIALSIFGSVVLLRKRA